MPLAEYVAYQAGYVPPADVEAQKRCYDYLGRAISIVNGQVANGDESKKTELQQLNSFREMVKASAGSYGWRKAATFWRYWDMNKNMVIQVVTHGKDPLSQIEGLEEGRFYPS